MMPMMTTKESRRMHADVTPSNDTFYHVMEGGTAANSFDERKNAVTDEPLRDSTSSSSSSFSSASSSSDKTTAWQTFIHLLKGNVGPGMLSLPWAFSVLGSIPLAFVAVLVMSFWSSYNCWTVVRIKRYMEEQKHRLPRADIFMENNGCVTLGTVPLVATTNITYPDVGNWAYGPIFRSYVSACICIQQLSICTVFVSFIGENFLAVLHRLTTPEDDTWWATHTGAITMVMPCCLVISFIPSLKGLAPVVTMATLFLFITLALLLVIAVKSWSDRPYQGDEGPTIQNPLLAFCAILYSFEGICLILPTESAMQNSRRDFGKVFVLTMVVVSLLVACFSAACVMAFGNVTNGSITAFLMQKYGPVPDEESNPTLQWPILVANTAVILSVLLTYPLQLFPAVELTALSWSRLFSTGQQQAANPIQTEKAKEDQSSEFVLFPIVSQHEKSGEYQTKNTEANTSSHVCESETDLMEQENDATRNAVLLHGSSNLTKDSAILRCLGMFLPEVVVMPKMSTPGDSIPLRATLVLLTYTIAVVVPNIQTLIALSGALAGSSTALLIPPLLELAFCRHLERSNNVQDMGISPHFEGSLMDPRLLQQLGGLIGTKIKCSILFALGLAFMLVGTWISLQDVIAAYSLGAE